MTSVFFVSLGCPKNLVDSEVMLGLLAKDSFKITDRPENAEVIIVNTCSFIQASKEESIATILEMARQKDTGKCRVLAVAGCLPQRYSKDLEREMPEVDLFIGTGEYHRIVELLNGLPDSRKRRSYVDVPAFIHTESDPRLHTGPRYSAFLKISEGCNRHCAFCVIPEIRGSVRSRTIDSLVAETTTLAAQGVRELNLVAQDLTEYGLDLKPRQKLEELLPALCKVEGIEWIRLHYAYPDQFSDELLEIIARERKIVKYLDMPIQHTVDRVLRSMCRGLNKKKLFTVVEKIRNRIPEMVFRTSIIVGFPGETEDDFTELCRDLEELNLDRVGVFSFSREEGTRAAKMDEQIHPATKRRRLKKLTEILEKQSLEKQNKYLGRRVQVLIEGISEESDLLIQGRMTGQAQEIDGHVLINDLGPFESVEGVLNPGDVVEVKITETMPHDLVGALSHVISKARK